MRRPIRPSSPDAALPPLGAAAGDPDALGASLAGLLLLVLLKAGFDMAGWLRGRRTARHAADEPGPDREDPAGT